MPYWRGLGRRSRPRPGASHILELLLKHRQSTGKIVDLPEYLLHAISQRRRKLSLPRVVQNAGKVRKASIRLIKFVR